MWGLVGNSGDFGTYSDADRIHYWVLSMITVCSLFTEIILIGCKEQGWQERVSRMAVAVDRVRDDNGVGWRGTRPWGGVAGLWVDLEAEGPFLSWSL